MVATLSPSADNYEETLSTLRWGGCWSAYLLIIINQSVTYGGEGAIVP